MANFGTAGSNNFQIGNAELRIGKMGSAGRMTQKSHSVGLLQSANVNFTQQSAELKGGLPLQLVDSVITETTVTVTAQAYEYTRRNIRAMLNEGIDDTAPDYTFTGKIIDSPSATGIVEGLYGNAKTTSSAAVVGGDAPALTLVLSSCKTIGSSVDVPATFTAPAGKPVTLGIYMDGYPEHLSIVQATAITTTLISATSEATATMTLTIDSSTPLLFDYTDLTQVVVYTINSVGLGNSDKTQYYTIDVLSKNHNSGNPQGFRFWKASMQGGMDYSFSNDSFAVTPMSFKILLPTALDMEKTGAEGLAHLPASMFSVNKLGMFWTGQDK